MDGKQNILEYKGYIAELYLDSDDDIIVGNVINTSDIISFHGETISEVREAFHDMLDTYLETCEAEGVEPSRPYSGRFNLRIDPSIHRQLSTIAAVEHTSLNEFVSGVLKNTVEHYNDHRPQS